MDESKLPLICGYRSTARTTDSYSVNLSSILSIRTNQLCLDTSQDLTTDKGRNVIKTTCGNYNVNKRKRNIGIRLADKIRG